MDDPVFVIHGVGHRDPEEFRRRVADLQVAGGNYWNLVPVYWGDLGADDRWVSLTIPGYGSATPPADGAGSQLRDGAGSPAAAGLEATIAAALLGAVPAAATGQLAAGGHLDKAAQMQAVADGVRRRRGVGGPSGGHELRDDPGVEVTAEEVVAAVAASWESTIWLRQVHDRAMLAETGAALAGALADLPETGEELRSLDVSRFVARRLADLDRVVGTAVGSAAGRVNAYLRTEHGPAITRFLGDVLVYQRRRGEVQQRVREVVERACPGLGRGPERPVRMIGHSLGGVVAIDLATADEPLWTSSLVTFGSQSPFFHVCDPRGGQLLPFEEGRLVRLPPSLGRWTNLWEPLDPLAFVAAPVFRLHDGGLPVDLPVPHLASSGLWTHSAYWRLPELVKAIDETLEGGR